MRRESRLKITHAVDGDEIWLRIDGELDLSTAAALGQALHDAERRHPQLVVLDVSRVEFADATALRLFVAASRRARLRHRRFALARPSRTVSRMLSITSLDRHLEVLA